MYTLAERLRFYYYYTDKPTFSRIRYKLKENKSNCSSFKLYCIYQMDDMSTASSRANHNISFHFKKNGIEIYQIWKKWKSIISL